MRISWLLAATACLSLSGVCSAQLPAGITPEMIASSLPEEGAPKAVPVPTRSPWSRLSDASLRTLPSLEARQIPEARHLPIVVWGNGGCAIDNTKYNGFSPRSPRMASLSSPPRAAAGRKARRAAGHRR